MTERPSDATTSRKRYGRPVATGAVVAVALVASWMGYEYGGYFVGAWGLAVFALAVLVAALALLGFTGMSRSWWSMAATALLTGYASWTFFSVFWSPNKGDAWSGAGLTMLYLLAFWVTVVLVSSGASRRWALAASALGPPVVAVVAVVTVLSIPTRLDELFRLDRLMGTVGYFNGEAAFLLVPFWVSIYVAGSRRMNLFLRAATLAGAAFGAEVAILTQSRGALVAMALSLPVYFIFSGQRLRGLIALAPVAVALVLTFPLLNEVYQALRSSTSPDAALEVALPMVWATAIGSGIYGLLFGIVDRLWRPGRNVVRVAGVLTVVVCATLVVVGISGFVEREGSPVTWGQERLAEFRTDDRSDRDVSRFLSAGGSGRNVLWAVAWDDFVSNPLLGVGTHNYEATYYQERESVAGYVRQPHMLALEVAAERGIVGGLLFFGFLGVCVASGVIQRFRSLNSEGKAQVGAMLAALTYWFVHSSVEWFWQLPAVTLPAMVYLALLVGPWTRLRSNVAPPRDLSLRMSSVGIAAIAVITVFPLYVSDHYVQRSEETDNPWLALQMVEQAQNFNPVEPRLARRESELAGQIGDFPRATQAGAREINLNPEHFAPYVTLAQLYERSNQPDRAMTLYTKALELNPLERDIQRSIDDLEERNDENR